MGGEGVGEGGRDSVSDGEAGHMLCDPPFRSLVADMR